MSCKFFIDKIENFFLKDNAKPLKLFKPQSCHREPFRKDFEPTLSVKMFLVFENDIFGKNQRKLEKEVYAAVG